MNSKIRCFTSTLQEKLCELIYYFLLWVIICVFQYTWLVSDSTSIGTYLRFNISNNKIINTSSIIQEK